MPACERVARSSCPDWLWAILPLLLAAALAIPLLDVDAYNGDEPSSLLAAGVLSPGSFSLAFLRDNLHANQAPGWPLLLAVWGRIVGWSEPAVRALPCFAGLLTLAGVYRTGRELFAPAAGLYAALLLGVSVFLLAYMAHARVFTLAALFATLCLWGYRRVALRSRPAGRVAQPGLLLGAAGLLWSHYFCALMLAALGLYHLLFAPRTASCPPVADGRAPAADRKTRRWWQATRLFGLAVLLAAAQLPFLLQGLELALSGEGAQEQALGASELMARLLRVMSNGLVEPSLPLAGLLLVMLSLALAGFTLLRLRAKSGGGSVWLPGFVSAALLLLLVAINERFQVVVPNAIRYLMPLWPLTALLAGTGLWRLSGRHRRLAVVLVALWLGAGVYLSRATDFRYETGYFFQSDFHHVYRSMRGRIGGDELLVLDFPAAKLDKAQLHTRMLGAPWEIIYRYREDPYDTVRQGHDAWPTLWLLYRTEHRAGLADFAAELGRALCERALDERGFTLERYALHSAENCPQVPARLEFEADILMTTPEIGIADGRLRLDAHFHSDDDALLANYSLALHVIDPRTGERVAQGDTGIGSGRIVPLRNEIDLSALPAGEYELRVGLYDWRTGARLHGRDLATGASGDMHTLQRFRLG